MIAVMLTTLRDAVDESKWGAHCPLPPLDLGEAMWSNKQFWSATLERAIKTAAQALLVLLGAGTTLADIPWETALLGVLGMTLASVLTSIVSYNVGPTGSPSMVVDEKGGRHSAS